MSKIKKFFFDFREILKRTYKYFQEDEPIIYSAAIAFFTIFSLPAILIIILHIGLTFFSEAEVREEIISQAEQLIQPEAAEQVNEVLENLADISGGFWVILIGILVVVKSATAVFFIMQKGINSMWQVQVKKNAPKTRVMLHRVITLLMVIGLGIILVVNIFLGTVVSIFSDQLYTIFGDVLPPALWLLNILFVFAVLIFIISMLYKYLPDARVAWKDALAGSIITSILFMIGFQIINYVLSTIKVATIYAAAGSLVILLLWMFYSSIILMLGAEVTRAYTNHYGRTIEPTSIAEKKIKGTNKGTGRTSRRP
jgi:membrane protein